MFVKGLKILSISILVFGILVSILWFVGALGWVADIELPEWLETKLEGMSFPGGYGMVNKAGAENPTYEELVDFIKQDRTDENQYISNEYTCLDFARDVHNNAEASGIRAGIVLINPGEEFAHALNVFSTVDNGLIFIDCTEYDTKAHVSVGESYSIEDLYPGVTPENSIFFTFVGTVDEYKIHWW